MYARLRLELSGLETVYNTYDGFGTLDVVDDKPEDRYRYVKTVHNLLTWARRRLSYLVQSSFYLRPTTRKYFDHVYNDDTFAAYARENRYAREKLKFQVWQLIKIATAMKQKPCISASGLDALHNFISKNPEARTWLDPHRDWAMAKLALVLECLEHLEQMPWGGTVHVKRYTTAEKYLSQETIEELMWIRGLFDPDLLF